MKKITLLTALFCAVITTEALAHDDYHESYTTRSYREHDYYRSGDYGQNQLVQRLNAKLDAEEREQSQSYYDRRIDEIYREKIKELERE